MDRNTNIKAIISTRTYFSFFLVLFALSSIRIPAILQYTLVISDLNIASIPWSDASQWVQGAEHILDGTDMPELASRRPIYPAFLSIIFYLFGGDYLTAIIVQTGMYIMAVILCFYLIKDLQEKYTSTFFLSCLALWLPVSQSLFMTENLGAMFLIIAFGLFLRSCETKSIHLYWLGLFFFSLSFFVRPWALGCLFTLPLMAFAGTGSRQTKVRNYLALISAILAGFVINKITLILFASPTSASNYPQVLYGLIDNSMTWRSASLDPVIATAMTTYESAAEVNKVIYSRCLEIFVEDPQALLKSISASYNFYFHHILSAFNEVYFIYPVFLLLFAYALKVNRPVVKKRTLLFLLVSAVSVSIGSGQYLFLALLILGTFKVFWSVRSNLSCFCFLYAMGILATLPIVGIDGGFRVRIANDIFLFLVAGMGMRHLFDTSEAIATGGFYESDFSISKSMKYVVSTLLLLAVIPTLLQYSSERAIADMSPKLSLTPESIAQQLHLESTPVPEDVLQVIHNQWPQLSFEGINGRLGIIELQYTHRDSVYLNNNVSLNSYLYRSHWPLMSSDPSIERTVHTRTWSIFPSIKPASLERFDGQHIYLIGKLIGKKRNWKNDTGLALLVEYIGTTSNEKEIHWSHINTLK